MIFADWAMLVILFLSVGIFVAVTQTSKMPQKLYNNAQIADLKIAIKLRNAWLVSSIICLTVHYFCILYSILSTLIVLYLSCFEDATQSTIKARLILYSALSLFTNVLPYILNLKKLSTKYRQAYISILDPIHRCDTAFYTELINAEVEISHAFED